MKRFELITLIALLTLAFALRVWKIDEPIADWHSFRQSDTAAVTRYYAQNQLDPLHPRYHDISSLQSGIDNPEGYRMVEFPIYNIVHLSVLKTLNLNSVDAAGRLTTALISILGAAFLYLIVRHVSGRALATVTIIVWALLPYNIFYNRVVLPDPTMVTLYLGAIWGFMYWESKPSHPKYLIWYGLSIFSAALALLTKPTAIFFLSPIPVWWIMQRGVSALKDYKFYLYGILALIPVAWWRLIWIPQFPAGIAVSDWLLNGDGIRLRPAWWRWLFYERIGNLILGGLGLAPLVLGLVSRPQSTQSMSDETEFSDNTNEWLYWIWLTAGLLYLIVFATGNVKHDYYQIPLIPILCIFIARGIIFLWTNQSLVTWIAKPITLASIALMLAFSWYQVKGFYQINNPAILEAGRQADEKLPADAKVLAPYFGDTTLLYHINRQGWPVSTAYPIQGMIDLGATHYVSVSRDQETKQIEQQYSVIMATDEFVIIDLTSPKEPITPTNN